MRLLILSAKVAFTDGAGGYGACVTRGTLSGAGGSVASVGVGSGFGYGAGVGSCTLGGAVVFLRIITLGAAWAVVTAGLGSGVSDMAGVAGRSSCSGISFVRNISAGCPMEVVTVGPYYKNGISGAGLRIIVMRSLIESVALSCADNAGMTNCFVKHSTVLAI